MKLDKSSVQYPLNLKHRAVEDKNLKKEDGYPITPQVQHMFWHGTGASVDSWAVCFNAPLFV